MGSPSLQKKEISDIRAWNEEMVLKHDPEAFHLHSSRLVRWIESRRVKAVLDAFRGKENGMILEVGCGAGNILEKVKAGRVVGIDFSLRMAKRTSERLANRTRVYSLQADGHKLPFQNQIFDGVICTEVLEHVEDPDQLLEEIHRTAKAGASIALSVPNEELINRMKSAVFKLRLRRILLKGNYEVPERMDDEWHLHVFDLKRLSAKLSHQFHIKKIIAIPFSFLPLRHVIVCTPK